VECEVLPLFFGIILYVVETYGWSTEVPIHQTPETFYEKLSLNPQNIQYGKDYLQSRRGRKKSPLN
jgi:hypothetical protein